MTKSKISTILLIVISLVVFIVISYSLFIKKGKKPNIPPPPPYIASFSLKADQTDVSVNQTVPVTLSFAIDQDPSNRGIVGIKATLKASPAEILSLSPTDIENTLPSPWQYLRKEVSTDGEITIETIYFQLEKTGYVATKSAEKLAIINLRAAKEGTIKLSVDKEKSEIRAKENNKAFDLRIEQPSISLTIR